MEYVKIKTQHALLSGLSDEELGRLVKIQALIAMKEKLPNDQELSRIIRLKTVENLSIKLQSLGENLQLIADKVLEDVEKTAKNREKTREKVAKSRKLSRLNSKNVTGYIKDSPCAHYSLSLISNTNNSSCCNHTSNINNNILDKIIFRIFKIRKKRNPLADTGLLRHLYKIDSIEERALWAVEIAEYKKTVFEKRKKQNEERKKRRDVENQKSALERNESFVRGVMIRFESIAEEQKNYVLKTAVSLYTAKNGEIQMPGKPSPLFIVGAMPHEVDSVLRDEIHV